MAKERSGESRTRWNEDEWASLLAAAMPVAQEEKMDLEHAIAKVQSRVLARNRLRKYSGIHNAVVSRVLPFQRALQKVKALSEGERVQLLPKPKRPAVQPAPVTPEMLGKLLAPGRIARMPGDTPEVKKRRAAYRGSAKWCEFEYALIARETKRLMDAKAYNTEMRCIMEAQDNVLPLLRRRAIEGLKKEYYDKPHRLKLHLQDIAPRMAEILSKVPPAFLQEAWAYDRAVAAEAATTPDLPAAVVAESAPVVEAAAQAPSDPNAGRTDVPKVSPAALAFATSMAYAVDDLLNQHTRAIVAEVESRMDARMQAMGETLAASVSARVAGDIQTNLARVVHMLMESELGPVMAPAAPAALNGHGPAEPIDIAPQQAERPRRFAVDVVGLTGDPVRVVSEALADLPQLDLRFMEPSQAHQANFRSNVVAVRKFISHKATQRIESQRCNFVKVNGAAQSVIAAVRDMVQKASGGVPVTH